MIDTVFFDLDGTLISLDEELFTQLYFKSLCHKVNDHIDAKSLINAINSGIKETILNVDDSITNEDVFYDSFSQLVGQDVFNKLVPLFNEYYSDDFNIVFDSIKQNIKMIEATKVLQAKGYKIGIITNPLFPQSAIHQRITFGGFNLEDFIYISSFEKNHFCKPQDLLYKEVLNHVDKTGNQCLMVGNNALEDMIASTHGFTTYLVTDELIDNGKRVQPSYSGTSSEFLEFCIKLPTII